jgi:hypothetical protein
MKRHKGEEPLGFIEGVKARQRNIVWPDTLRNGRAVDVFLWRGSMKPPLVQSIGAWLIGVAYIMVGLGLVGFAIELKSVFSFLPALAYVLLGIRVFRNGFGKRRPTTRAPRR